MNILAALPFLPLGKGALILIAGGSVVLGFSLVWSLASRRADPAAIAAHVPRRLPHERHARTRRRPSDRLPWIVSNEAEVPPVEPWMPAFMARIRNGGRGRPRLVHAQPGQHRIVLADCATCRDRPGISSSCEAERRFIEAEAHAFEHRSRVVETACNVEGACEFQIWTGGLS